MTDAIASRNTPVGQRFGSKSLLYLASHKWRWKEPIVAAQYGMGWEKRFLGLGVRRVSGGGCRRWKLMLDLLYLLSLMSLRSEDFVRDS